MTSLLAGRRDVVARADDHLVVVAARLDGRCFGGERHAGRGVCVQHVSIEDPLAEPIDQHRVRKLGRIGRIRIAVRSRSGRNQDRPVEPEVDARDRRGLQVAHGRQIRMRGTFGWEQIEHEPVRHGHNHVVRRDRLAGTEDDPGRAAVCDRQVSDAGLQPYAGRALRQPARQPCPVERIERHGRNLDFPSVAVGEKPVDKDLPRAGDVDPLESLAQRADEHGRPKAIDGRLGLAMPGQPRGKMFVVRVSIERAWGARERPHSAADRQQVTHGQITGAGKRRRQMQGSG